MNHSFGQRDPDARGYYGAYGGRFVPETLVAPVEELERAYFAARQDPDFRSKLEDLLRDYVGRPTPLYEAQRLSQSLGGGRIFLKEVPDPENFGVVVYDGDGRVTDIVEKAGVVDMRYAEPPSRHAVVGLYCFPPDVFDVIEALEPSSRGELEITDVNRHYAVEGRLDVVEVEGWWEDAGKHWRHLAEIGRRVEETGVNR